MRARVWGEGSDQPQAPSLVERERERERVSESKVDAEALLVVLLAFEYFEALLKSNIQVGSR